MIKKRIFKLIGMTVIVVVATAFLFQTVGIIRNTIAYHKSCDLDCQNVQRIIARRIVVREYEEERGRLSSMADKAMQDAGIDNDVRYQQDRVNK